ncbi:hypothetical protein DVH05_020944 [Phytophthora capsici]|nr:hypothetical protein DVH05_020944 [Phytophthora capsici]
MRAKQTLQLRHQLSASGLSLRAAAYDTKRHHVLSYDSHFLRPHVLRLFSLRRELKSVSLLEQEEEGNGAKRAVPSPSKSPQGRHRPSFLDLQQQKSTNEAKGEVVVPIVLLQYSPLLDVFLCVYSKATRAKNSTKVPKATTHYVLLLEPATLRKLLVYQGPETHLLQCAHYDTITDRLVLASHLKITEDREGMMFPSAPKNVVEILQLSKRLEDRQGLRWGEEPRMLLLIENTRASLRHPDTLTIVCGSKGLKALYGAANECDSAETSLLEWRQNQLKFLLVRRVMLRHGISAMTVSPCGDWLLAGSNQGGLRVWNVNGSRTNASELFTIDAEPFEPSGSCVAGAQSQVISSIEATTTPMPNSTDEAVALADVIVIVAERDTGVVRHWRFSMERKTFESDNEILSLVEHRYPRLSLVGVFDTGAKEQLGKGESPCKFKHQDTLGPPLKTLTMCVTIDMGSCFENLLLVVREDVIHVLKVQTVLYVMQEFSSIEQAYAVRAFGRQDSCQVISLSSTAACKLRLFPLDENSHQSSSKLLFVAPQTSENTHVCSMETITSSSMQLSFVVLAWSNGVVDIYDILTERHVMKLEDKHLADQISTLCVVQYHRAIKRKKPPLPGDADKGGLWSSRSDENYTTIDTHIDEPDEDVERRIIIFVGTESGKLFGWKTDALLGENIAFQNILNANVRVQAAHPSHIIQLARFDAVDHDERPLLASVGTGGIIKFWRVPSLKVVGYINSVAEGYPVSPSSIELLEGVGTGNEMARNFVAVGFEDGRVAVWKVDFKRVLFQRLDVSTKHERCVSKICRVSSEIVLSGLVELLSCSLDMTVIQWEILDSGTVHEKQYFDIGFAIVDMVLVKEQAVVALAHQVCKFAFAPSSKCDVKYLAKPEAEVNADTDQLQKASDDNAVLPTGDSYPDTPTTRSLDGATEATSATERTVDEYLTLHVPSAVLHLEASSLTTGTGTGSRELHEDAFNLRNEAADKTLRCSKTSKCTTGQLPDPFINDDILRDYLQEYLARHGTAGTMAASRITHLLVLRPELPSIKRPGFALAKCLKDLKLTAQDRVDTEDALQILKLLLAISKKSSSSFDAPTMSRSLKLNDNTSQQTRAHRLREKNQVRRKPVVTYNVLGEKYVRWEERSPKRGSIKRNQAPSSPITNLALHTPPSPNMRDKDDLESNSAREMTGFVEPEKSGLDSSANDEKDLDTDSPRVSSTGDAEEAEESGEESEEEDEEEEEGEEEEQEDDGNDTGDDTGDENEELSTHKDSSVALNEAAPIPAAVPAKPMRGIKRLHRYANPNDNMSSDGLVNSIRLSPMFQPFWTKDYCWCCPAPPLIIGWTDDDKAKRKKVRRKCKVCHKRQHTVDLPRVGYAPHFSRQVTFDIIVEVYSKLTATAHSSLYKNTRPQQEKCSIFGVLFDVFLTTYGVRSTVELKLKLFFISMCRLIPEYDAVAVFGELLGLHKSNVADEYDHTPATLVSLCVCCYSWLYSRGMVVNGDSFSGRIRGCEWNVYRSATEVVPTTDGTSHWQFVRIEHALLCAQDNLLYPLVSPGFLRNIMLFMQDYGQRAPTRSVRTDSPDFGHENTEAHWIEIHRFLRLLVGEWKHQNAEFRLMERLLFIYPQRDAAIKGELLEKLRLLLSCFIFYDHERVGVMAIGDFEALLYKLRYLWPIEGTDLPLSDKAFEKAIVAVKKRFLDLSHDGLLCYLDFWAMLYIVGVKTRSLIHFLELPSFCRDYRLEMSAELSGMVWNYMQLSCTLLLPKGLQVGKSSMDQKAEHQHRRRVGGLHDGTFHFSKTLKGSLSAQELLGTEDTQRHGLYLDGSVPASRQTASTTALDRFRPVSVEDELHAGDSSRRGREPVVVGVRPTGPTPKRVAPLSVSLMGSFEAGNVIKAGNYVGVSSESVRRLKGRPNEKPLGYTNMYIQFPQVTPVRKLVNPNERIQVLPGDPIEDSKKEEAATIYEKKVVQEEPERVDILPALTTASIRPLSSKATVSIPEPILIIDDEPIVEMPRSTTKIVVVPTVETDSSIITADPQASSRSLLRVGSDRLQLEETAVQLEETTAQLEAEQEEEQVSPPHQLTPVPTPTPTPREDLPEIDDENMIPIENDSEMEADDVEQPVELVEDVLEESVTTVDAPPEPESVEVPPEPIAVPLSEELVVENVVETLVVDEEPPEQMDPIDAVKVDEPLVEQAIPTPRSPPSPVEEPAPVEISIAEVETPSDLVNEEVKSEPEVSSYQPQVLKQDDIQIHHTFRFSQQPTFLRGVVVTNNPYRTAMWNPDDDSESDGSESGKPSPSQSTGSNAVDVASVYTDDVNPCSSLKTPKEESTALHLGPSPSTLTKQSPSRDLIRLNKLQTRRSKLDHHFSDDLEAIQDEGDDNQSLISDGLLLPFRQKRLGEEAERALYGERVVNVLGEGIAFSAEAEAAMQHKWQQFFDDSEEKMFSAMRNDLEKKQTEQREAEERQNKLRKKWQEQRDQDLMRLQHSRHNSSLMTSKQNDGDNEASAMDAAFRLRRIHRESCRQLTEELQFGVSVQRELEDVKATQFFHFYYQPEGYGSIITLKMHVLKGDAEVFMSTDTKVPCSTDFMWRSSERLARGTDEGHRIVLYPHDLLKVASSADKTSLRIGFYLSVVALEPGTSFTLAVMSSGQKMQPSQAIQTVDYLIDRFNMLSRLFEAQSNDSQAHISRRRAVIRRQSFAGFEDDIDADEEEDNSDDTATESTEMVARRKTKKVDDVDPQELKSFQYLLETLSERKGFGSPRASSILLEGPSEDHLEFVRDEDQRLQEMHQQLSPPKTLGAPPDPLTVVTERRLTMQGKRQKLRRVVAARLQQKLAPLRHKPVGGELEKSVSTGTLGNIRPVAYSISTLDPLPRSQRFTNDNRSSCTGKKQYSC